MLYFNKLVGVRLQLNDVKRIEEILKRGKFRNSSDFIRTAIREKLDKEVPS